MINFFYCFFTLAFYFILYAHLGWYLEVIYAFYSSKKFVNRGFLFGPYCSMYGVAAIVLIYSLRPFENNIIILFIASVVITSVIEYITGYILEKMFNTTWWDYSEDPLNLHGRICLGFSLLWGAIAVLLVKIVNPFFDRFLKYIHSFHGRTIISIILILMIVDLVFTLISISRFNVVLEKLKINFEETKNKILSKNKVNDNEVQDILVDFTAKYENIFKSLQKDYSRFIMVFPKYTVNKFKSFTSFVKSKLIPKDKFKS